MGEAPVVPKWRLVPSLTFAGLISALFTEFIWWPATLVGKNGEVWCVLGSISLGLALCAVVWFYGLVRNWKVLAGLVAVTVAVHLLERQAETYAGVRLREYSEIPVLGNVEPLVAATSFAVALVLYTAWILLTSPRYKAVWGVLLALGPALLASLTITVIHGTQRGAWIGFFRGSPLELVWQTGLAFFLGIALALKRSVCVVHALPDPEKPHRSFKTQMAAISLIVGYFIVTGIWSTSVEKREAKKRAQLVASIEAEAATKLTHAPSLENLPPLGLKPLDEVLVWKNIGDWKLSNPGSYVSPLLLHNAMPLPGLEAQIAPERRTYYVTYSGGEFGYQARVDVTAYPNAEWARYEVEVPPITRQAHNVQVLNRFGNKVYQEGPYFFWSSGDFVVHLDCQGIKPELIDEFLKAYLQNFPSNL